MLTKRKCPACGYHIGESLYRNKMNIPFGVNLANEYDIICCDRCGNCYADTDSTEADYDDYYSNHNYYGNWQYNSSSQCDLDVICRMLSRVVSNDSLIVDMGCGNGKLLHHLHNNGFTNLVGVDPSERSIANLHHNGLSGVVGSIYEHSNATLKADVVIFTMVLEHLLTPDKAITNIQENYLNTNGRIVVTWPYFEDLIADGTPIPNNFNHEHINYFSVHTADILFARFGFKREDYHISLGVGKEGMVQFSNVAMYKISQEVFTYSNIKKETKTKQSILEYINRYKHKELHIANLINKIAQKGSPVVIWGTGAYLMHLMSSTVLNKCNIAYFVDNNIARQGQDFFGYMVKSPEEIVSFEGTVIITAMLYAKDIQQQIRDLGNTTCEIILL